MSLSPVQSFNLHRSLADIEADITEAIGRVLKSGHVILGGEGRALEEEFAEFVGARFAVGVSSGTDALILALKAVGAGYRDEVITVANTAVPTASAIRAVGAIPRFVDVDPTTLLMDLSQIESAITERTKALIPVHLFGLPVDMAALNAIARRHNLFVIEDCAHAHGARDHGIHVGTQGDIGCFSFYPTKNIGALGDAGICVTQNPELARRLQQLRMYGFDENRIAVCDGLNSRLDEIQAAILRIRLRGLEASISHRNAIASRYLLQLADLPLRLPATRNDSVHGWHQFVIRVADRENVMKILGDNLIGSGIHYPVPLHQMPAFSPWVPAGQTLPVTEAAALEILSVPMSGDLTSDECERVVRALRAALTGGPK
jgi:dTDP-4-amino-4,6-dideoxygalactose transaminase